VLCPSRYHFNLNILLGQLTKLKALRWASPPEVMKELEAQVGKLLGPKTEADLKPPERKKKEKKVGESAQCLHHYPVLTALTSLSSTYCTCLTIQYSLYLSHYPALAILASLSGTHCTCSTTLSELNSPSLTLSTPKAYASVNVSIDTSITHKYCAKVLVPVQSTAPTY
jgi:Glutaminyl-tRNA synthetase, non-specific RNA binding region part 2